MEYLFQILRSFIRPLSYTHEGIMFNSKVGAAILSVRDSVGQRALNYFVFVALTFVSLCTAGCVTVSSGPDRIFDATAELPSLMAYANVPGNQADKQSRNTFVAARMYAIDIEYSAYFERLLKEKQLGSSALDATLLGLTAATTIVHGEAVKTTLAAISTAVAGAKTDIDQDIYMAQTLQILMNTMEAQRLAIRNRIDGNMKLAASDYTAWRALTDLDDYYRAGTMAGALNYLASTTGSNAQAQKDLQNGTTPSATAAGPNSPSTPTQGMTSLKASVQALPHQ
jgi:hypothetical protein